MMEDLFNVDLDFNLDLGLDDNVDDNFDFLPEDLFDFIDQDLRDITENDAIPNIENLINFDEDEFADDIQWDFDLDTTDFFENVQEHQQASKSENEKTTISKSNNKSSNSKSSASKSKRSNKQNKKQQQNKFSSNQNGQNLESIVSLPASPSPTNYSTENTNDSNDSSDFLDLFQNYYSLDSNNNLISHPITNLSIDEINNLTSTFNQQVNDSEHTKFDLSNNFGGFVNMQSALTKLNLMNNLAINYQPKLVTCKLKKSKSRGTSLLASKPKSYKTIKKEMQQKKHLTISKSTQLTNRCLKANQTRSSIQITPSKQQTNLSNNLNKQQQKTHTTTTTQIKQITIISTYAQDHDYCSSSI